MGDNSEDGNSDMMQRVQSSFGTSTVPKPVGFNQLHLNTAQFRTQNRQFSPSVDSAKRVGIPPSHPPVSPYSQIPGSHKVGRFSHSLGTSHSRPLSQGSSLPPLSPSPYRDSPDQVVGDVDWNSPPSSPLSIPLRSPNTLDRVGSSRDNQKPVQLVQRCKKSIGEGNAKGMGERKSEGEVVDNLFNAYMNLDNLDTSGTENREDLDSRASGTKTNGGDSTDNEATSSVNEELKMRYITELEHKVQTLQTEATMLSAELILFQRDSARLTSQNNELKFRLQAMGQQAQLRDVPNSRTSEIEFIEISSPISTYMNYPQQSVKGIQMVDNYMPPSGTTLTLLPQDVTEPQFGIEQATKNRNEPDDELNVPYVENSTRSDKILQEKILLPVPEALERGKKPMLENYIAPSARRYKTAPILLSKEDIKHQYGNTMNKAAKNLNVSISTLKRKCKDFGISEWQGPNPVKRKLNDSSNQSYTNEEFDGAVQDPSAIIKNENTLTIKAEYADDMIKFHLGISEATFITVEEEIGKKFKLTHGTYKLKYLDEDEDWILLASDQDMSDCMKSSRNLGGIVVRLCVLPSTQPISG